MIEQRGKVEAMPRLVPTTRLARCGACGLQFTEQAWRKLALVEEMTAREIVRHVVRWPAGDSIEIRTCGACGSSIAKRFGRERGR